MATQALSENAPVVMSLAALRKAENACRRCPLYQDATQAVPGERSRDAAIMLVGEQPGDKEDLAGKSRTCAKLRPICASVAVRKFARILSLLRSELPNQSDTSNPMILVSL